MSWASVFPKELSSAPQPQIVLTGLDVKNNQIHREIWDTFNARSGQNFRYKLLDGDYEYPKSKPDRSYEFYVPKGILKSNWIDKHLNVIPSMVVVFFDLEWDEANWKEKQMECATKVELVRHGLSDRNTRIIVVLIQKQASPVGEDNIFARERYPALCAACSIKNGYIFLLHADHLQGYIAKLEEEPFTELTQTYYNLEIKSIKFKKDSLNKITQQYLFVRLDFKVAFFYEMKQSRHRVKDEKKEDLNKAIEMYLQAYSNLLEIRFFDSNLLEIKIIAGFISFKICQLLFATHRPGDAIAQFRRHIDIFRNKIGQPELEFEHCAWLSKQFSLFGDLFDESIREGRVKAAQHQHPGFYYHPAANHAIKRRSLRKELQAQQTPDSSFVESLNQLEFFGQRPWRQGQQSAEILDVQKERDNILCLQALELQEDLTPLITDLFKKAIIHSKRYNCERMKQYLMVSMADEYFVAKDYQVALSTYVNVLNDYKTEHWWPILTSIMINALKCAYLTADVTNFCLLSVELMGKNILLSDEDKLSIQQNLLRVLSNELPSPPNLDATHSVNDAIAKWQNELSSVDKMKEATPPIIDGPLSLDDSFNLNMSRVIPAYVSSLVPFVECKIEFASNHFNSNEQVRLRAYLRVNCVEKIQFNKLQIRFNMPHYNQYCVERDANVLLLEPNKINKIEFKFNIERQDIGKEIEVNTISLEMGDRAHRAVVFYWKGDCKNALSFEPVNYNSKIVYNIKETLTKEQKDENNLWNLIKVKNKAMFINREAKMEIQFEHNLPVLVNEFYAIKVNIINKEKFQIDSLNLSVCIFDEDINQVKDKVQLKIGSTPSSIIAQTKNLPAVKSDEQISEIVYVRFSELMKRDLLFKVDYENDIQISEAKSIKCTCIKEAQLSLSSKQPFSFNFSILSTQMEPLATVHNGEPFILMCEIRNQSEFAIKFKNSGVIKNEKFMFKNSNELESYLKEETLNENEMATECFCMLLKSQESYDANYNIGDYFVEWRRSEIVGLDSDELFIETKVALPDVKIKVFPFHIECITPPFAYIDEDFQVINKIKNSSNKPLNLECSLEDNEFFSIAGDKMKYIQIMPFDNYEYFYNLFPLKSGHNKLPKIHIKFNMSEGAQSETPISVTPVDELDLVIQRMVTSDIYVMPFKRPESD